jgi:NADH-quinone oxidoreductase subunit M
MIIVLLGIPIATLVGLNSYLVTSSAVIGSSVEERADAAKIITLASLFINLLVISYVWKVFPKHFNNGLITYPSALQGDVAILFDATHNLGLPFVLLSTAVLIVALLTAWYSKVDIMLFSNLMLVLEVCLIGAFTCSNLFVFLLFFEASALPIFILIAYCGSVRRERIKASYYFMFFTLYGSLALLLVILNYFSLRQIDFLVETPAQAINRVIWLLLFVAFAVKIPLVPVHIWLPYAHVEASTSTSILLAALILKLGGYGVLKFIISIFTVSLHLFFRPLAIFICVVGVIYGGLAALRQIDMKRQIAFSSISHISFAIVGIFTFTEVGSKGAVYLMLSHGLTSAALFFLVGVLTERYHTRSVLAFSGLLSVMPVFAFFIIVISLANVGFPGTSGFLPELIVLVSVVSSSASILFAVLLGMLLTTASSLVLLLRILFGHVKVLYFQSSFVDLTRLEFVILAVLIFWVLVLGLYDVLAWV